MAHDHQRQHKLEERLSDAAAELVSAQIKVLEAENDGQVNLADERWQGHKEAHAQLAAQLEHSQSQANEWRGSLSDLRNTFVTMAEWKAEHRALITRVETLEQGRAMAATEASTVRDLFGNMRNLLLLCIALIGVALTLITFFRG